MPARNLTKFVLARGPAHIGVHGRASLCNWINVFLYSAVRAAASTS
jgi:hypothetical protein